jgi:hypothetical protein
MITKIREQDLKLLVQDKDEMKVFIDAGVYTKNRNFRLFLSSKLGKDRPLVISDKTGCLPDGTQARDGRLFKISRCEENKRLGLLELADEADFRTFFMNSLGRFSFQSNSKYARGQCQLM